MNMILAAALSVGSLLLPPRPGTGRADVQLTRRDAVCQTAAATLGLNLPVPALADVFDVGSGQGMSVAQVESKLQRVPTVALVNSEDQPFFTGKEGGKGVGYFYLEPSDALLDLRLLLQTQPDAKLKVVSLTDVYFPIVRSTQDFGGLLRLRPSRKQIVFANRALQFNSAEGTLVPTQLDESKGQVPVFYSERVSYGEGASATFPFFLRKEDLDAAFVELQGATAASSGADAGQQASPPATEPSSGRRGKKREAPTGLPIGLVRVATLDGLVKQMRTGEVDLRQAVVVGSPEALSLCRQLLADGSATGKLQ